MQRTLTMSRDVMFLMLPLGRSLPCRVVATVILAVVAGAAVAQPRPAAEAGAPTVGAVCAIG